MIQIQSFTFNAFEENTYLLWDETKQAVLIDAGCYEQDEKDELVSFIEQNELQLKYLLHTHSHLDHVLGADFIKEKYKVPIVTHPKDVETYRMNSLISAAWGFPKYKEAKVDLFVNEGDSIEFGNSKLEVLFTPGHSAGHIVFVNKAQNFCINGDVLFRQSIGRTDLPGGNWAVLENSIRQKMYKLPDEMIVYCGHGSPTSIGYEKKYNPFVSEK